MGLSYQGSAYTDWLRIWYNYICVCVTENTKRRSMRRIFKPFDRLSQAGFSLLELLVVISIIGILVTMSVAAFTNAQQKSRNARRRTDVKAIQNAMEQYYSINSSSYPSSGGGTPCAVAALSTFLSPFPEDPKNSGSNQYSCATGASAYCVCAYMEGSEAGNSNAAASSTACGGLGNSGSYFCVRNLQ